MPFKKSRHSDGVAKGAVARLLRLWPHETALWRHAVWIRIVTSHSAWMGHENQFQNLNHPRAIHKNSPHSLEKMGKVQVNTWYIHQCIKRMWSIYGASITNILAKPALRFGNGKIIASTKTAGYPVPNFNGGLVEPPLTLGRGWIITSV